MKDTRELIVTRLITLAAKIRLRLCNYPERWRGSRQVPARIRGRDRETRESRGRKNSRILLVSGRGENTHYRAIPSQYGTRYE